jgi:hypothetical protein
MIKTPSASRQDLGRPCPIGLLNPQVLRARKQLYGYYLGTLVCCASARKLNSCWKSNGQMVCNSTAGLLCRKALMWFGFQILVGSSEALCNQIYWPLICTVEVREGGTRGGLKRHHPLTKDAPVLIPTAMEEPELSLTAICRPQGPIVFQSSSDPHKLVHDTLAIHRGSATNVETPTESLKRRDVPANALPVAIVMHAICARGCPRLNLPC